MNNFSDNPRLTLVGAGPGDPELITLKGVRALQTADVVLYDALVHPDLLQHAPASAERVFVGKRRGRCEFAQADINHLIVQYAHSHGHVVRLKGGDPFVFGRGFEELAFAQDCGVAVDVVPGLSSSYAVPALAGIPLTCRGISESFWVLTGTTKDHQLSGDIGTAVQSTATLVVLMGMKHLPDIVAALTEQGRANVPVAVIQNGSWADERVALAPAHRVVETVENHKLTNPAIIVIGEVVRLHPDWHSETEVASGAAISSPLLISR
ncbi:uroporphyrinogen-III C-methyltransferase [Spirosoma montaniterrae]|uniref:uroporphyrinogen-III C-methyltransferase n=1 Tax=Spirosoma montaniterrae TaxID=1178516 RepID=A0A1P9X2B0_9BACT|nr:uroporphyrinogen-III C-methyltransferase [Spirosoma montaniterrae]AQG81764.1 uroporphyrin-III methyltransferase [Spirosoma montaniterrae]